MAYEPFQRNYYRGGGGAGFGGNAFVSLLGGAAQGLLSAQKNRAELIKQAQEEALRRAAEQRAIDSSAREQERLNMARKQQEEASKERMKAEEERQRLLRKQREEEARIRADSEKLFGEYQANPEMAEYYTETEMKAIARRVAAGEINPPRPPKPKTSGSDLNFYATPVEEQRLGARDFLQKWNETHLGKPQTSASGASFSLPPEQGNVLYGPDNRPITDPAQAHELVLIPQLRRAITQMQEIIARAEPGSRQWYEARRNMEEAAAVLQELERQARGGGGDFASQDFDYSGVSVSPTR